PPTREAVVPLAAIGIVGSVVILDLGDQARADQQVVVAGAAIQDVEAVTAADRIVTALSMERVVAQILGLGADPVVAIATVDRVASFFSLENVSAGTAIEDVVASAAQEFVTT